MSRISNAILTANTGINVGHNAPMLDLQHGGQIGFAPDLAEWVSNQAFVRRNVIPLLVEAPKGFQLLNNPSYWVGTLRSLVELHPLSVDGLQGGLEVEVASTPVGGGGQQQEDVTNVVETQTKVVFRWGEKYGMPVATFMRGWITNLIMDPNTKYPNVVTTGTPPTDMLADMYSATMLFIEPDPTHTTVVKSWLVTNMYPTGTGEITGRRDLTQANETPTYDISFTGIAQYSLGVDAFAQQILSSINLTGANPQLRAAFVQAISADVAAAGATGNSSYTGGVATLESQQVAGLVV
jgi:hypothetical protein